VADHAVRTAKEAIRDVSDQATATVREATIGRAGHMVNDASETAKGFGSTVTETIRQNPIPATLAGVGLGWLIMRSRNLDRNTARYRAQRFAGAPGYAPAYGGPYRRDEFGSRGASFMEGRPAGGELHGRVGEAISSMKEDVRGMASGTQDTVSEMTGKAQDTLSEMAERTKETASDLAERTKETASDLAERAREQADYLSYEAQHRTQQVRGQFEQMLQDNPLALGAMALACGAALGMLLPATTKENQLMGSARDSLMESAQETAQDTMQKVQRVADQATNAASDAAKDQGLAA